MASKITAQARLSVQRDGNSPIGNKSVTRDMTGTHCLSDVQSVSTAAEAVTLADLANVRYAYFYNSSAGTVTVTTTAIVLKPGDMTLFPPANGNITLQATGATTDVDKVLTEA
jgi:hypothetical protein